MKTILMKITTKRNAQLDDDVFIEECMDLLRKKHPAIAGYTYERTGKYTLNLMVWGDLELVTE
jgi:hypothetical protein